VTAYYWIELLQMAVASVGLVVALSEWGAIRDLRRVGTTEAQRALARHAAFVEVLRLSVHVVILASAGVSLALPEPPTATMPGWIIEALWWRKLGLLWVAVIATAGTVSSRITRVRVAGLLRDAR